MELFLFRPLDYERIYNCSLIVVDSVPVEKRRHVLYGTIFIAMFFVYEAMYVPCIWSMCGRLQNECYKMLLFIGVVDMLALCIIGLLTGILAIQGAVFCSHPTLIYVAGCATKSLYNAEIIMEFILSINRCLRVLSPAQSELLFKGNRTWVWCVLTVAVNIYWFFFIRTIGFNAQYFNWFPNPFQGYKSGADFNAMLPPDINSFLDDLRGYLVLVGIPIVYGVFSIGYAVKTWRFKNQLGVATAQNAAEKKTFLQVLLIAGINAVTPILYKIINLVPSASNEIIVAAMFGWLQIHAAPPVILLLFNKSVRSDVQRQMRWLRSLKLVSNLPMSQQHHQQPAIQMRTVSRVAPAANSNFGQLPGQGGAVALTPNWNRR